MNDKYYADFKKKLDFFFSLFGIEISTQEYLLFLHYLYGIEIN